MRRFVLSCLTGLALMTGYAPSAGAFELGNLLNEQTSTSEGTHQPGNLLNEQTPTSEGTHQPGNLLNEQTSTSEGTPQLINPTATPCLDIIAGCSVITLDQNSIELLNPELSIGIDGSLTIESIGSWTNAPGLYSQQAKVVIRLPRQMRPLAPPSTQSRTSQTAFADKTRTCTESPVTSGNNLSLTELSEVLMGQKAISQSAALFTSGCHR